MVDKTYSVITTPTAALPEIRALNMKNFKLTDETKVVNGVSLHRIEATKDMPDKCVKAGDKGGWVEKESNISGNAWVSGDARVSGNARVFGNAWVFGNADICYMSMFGSSNRTTTAFRCNDEIVRVKCGCFYGDLDEFKKQIEETHGDNKYARQYLAMIELIKAKFEL